MVTRQQRTKRCGTALPPYRWPVFGVSPIQLGLRREKSKVSHLCCGHAAHPGFHQPEVAKVAALQVAVTKVPEGHPIQKRECTCCPSSWRTELRRRQVSPCGPSPSLPQGQGLGTGCTLAPAAEPAPPAARCASLRSTQGSQPHSRGLQYLLAHTRSSPAGCTERPALPLKPPALLRPVTAPGTQLGPVPWPPSPGDPPGLPPSARSANTSFEEATQPPCTETCAHLA